nr:MAG TPA: hypothetical protein [Caudoviricetes sp.]
MRAYKIKQYKYQGMNSKRIKNVFLLINYTCNGSLSYI